MITRTGRRGGCCGAAVQVTMGENVLSALPTPPDHPDRAGTPAIEAISAYPLNRTPAAHVIQITFHSSA
jgi:hypothetical protein